jgi:uncharacterized protein (TIGR00299 family) protein
VYSGRILFIEPCSGISGDMMLGALLDLGIGLEIVQEKLRLLSLQGYRITLGDCSRAGIRAARLEVECGGFSPGADGSHQHSPDAHPHRSFRDIRTMIESSGLSDWVKRKSIEAFYRLAEAEGKIHSQAPEAVHFHEVGAVDSIIDIVGTMAAVEELLPARIFCAAVNVGQGALTCRHGRYPAPGPATIELLRGVPVFSTGETGELTTPTGAALLVALADSFGARPAMRVNRVGYGAGAREFPGSANVLRITYGESWPEASAVADAEQVAVIEATIDDMTPQVYGYFQEKALEAGALDVYAVPAQMKKNRPGLHLTVLCRPELAVEMENLVFSETTTIGLRSTLARRKTLQREYCEVKTEYGTVTVKVCSWEGRRLNIAPEYESCRRLALENSVSLKSVMTAASLAYRQLERIQGE